MCGKTKTRVTHVPRFLPPTSIHPCVGFPHYSYHCTISWGLEPSLATHSVPSLFHMTLAM